jgi:putative cell wall-binding protein
MGKVARGLAGGFLVAGSLGAMSLAWQAAAGAVASVTLYVTSAGTATSGCTAAKPCSTIQEGVAAAESFSGDPVTLTVAAGVYQGGVLVTAAKLTSLTIEGRSGPATTVVTGYTAFQDVTVSRGTVTISGLSIDHGSSTAGGGVHIGAGSTVILSDDAFSNDSAHTGGGVFDLGSATLSDDVFSGDSATFRGGGFTMLTGAMATLTDDRFTTDSAREYGGGLSNTGGKARVSNATFSGDAADYGGGLLNISDATLTDDTFSADSATYRGGGVYNSGVVHLVNDTLVGDDASVNGGGLLNAETATVTDATFLDDSAGSGGGVSNVTSGTAAVSASILESSSCSSSGASFETTYDVSTTSSCASGPTDKTVTASELRLTPALQPNGSTGPETLALLATSAAVDAIPKSACTVTTDERGQPRPGVKGQTNCDAGAFELQYPPQTVTANRIYGVTADATAAEELESVFNPTAQGANATTGTCVGNTTTATNKVTTNEAKATARVVILATDSHFPDALSSQYLAGYLKTGTLLTPTTSLSTVTKAALRAEGVTRVIVVGGPLAVTTTVVSELEALPAYTCGGGHALETRGSPARIHVTRIWGPTQYDTALHIAESVPEDYVATAGFPTAYSGTNATGGTGKYNDTAGTGSSSAPAGATALKTAIVASGAEFQDAMAASALAYRGAGALYARGLPVLLTSPASLSPQVSDAIDALAIKQVIVMGGPLAVTNTVTNALAGAGVSVLRVAGRTDTDTAVQLARFLAGTTGAGIGWSHITALTVSRGNGFTDGLAGAVISGSAEEPEMLTGSPTDVGPTLTAFLKASGPSGTGIDTRSTSQVSALTVFGGPLAVTTTVVMTMEQDLGG